MREIKTQETLHLTYCRHFTDLLKPVFAAKGIQEDFGPG